MQLGWMLLLVLLASVGSTAPAHSEEINILRFWTDEPSSPPANVPVSRALFVSSWSAQGRKFAIQFAGKFESIILCLYDLRFQDRKYYLERLTEIEPSFVKQLKNANPNVKVILRIFLSSSAKSIFEYVSSSTKKIADLSAAIAKTMRKERADGILYDSLYNLPVKMGVADTYGPYDKFAILLNSYIVNRLREELSEQERLICSINLGSWSIEDIDFSALRQIKAHGIVVDAIDNNQADVSLLRALTFAKEMKKSDENMEIYLAVPLFSWRNGIGMKTSTVKAYLDKYGVAFRGFKNGLCLYVEKNGGAENNVPCDHYFQVAKKYAHQSDLKLAFFEAGDAIQEQFELI